MKRLLLVLLLVGCATQPGRSSSQLNDAIGAAYTLVATTATAAHAACGNVAPDGPCLPGRPITTQQEALTKAGLLAVLSLLDQATTLLINGHADSASTLLNTAADAIVAQRKTLTDAGVQL